jgi:hypothetical protein
MEDHNGLPPKTYNLSEHAFRPGLSFGTSIQHLNDTVMRLYNQGRLRSAVDELFKVLDKDPHNSEALELALIIVGGLRTAQRQAHEPLTPAYLLDRRLDPIVTVCSHCGKAWIGGDPLLMPAMQFFQSLIMINSGAPRPMQCYTCGYVLCSECIIARTGDDPLDPQPLSNICPNCGAATLKRPAYPTGRPPQQMARHAELVAQVVIFREGPIPPDEGFLKRFLEPISPDALSDSAKLLGIPIFPWPSNIEAAAVSILIQKHALGEIKGSLEHAEYMHARDEQENRIYIAKLMMSPEKAKDKKLPESKWIPKYQIEDRIGSLMGWVYAFQLKMKQSPIEKLIENTIRSHMDRMIQTVQNTPNSGLASHWQSLLSPPVLAFTQKKIATELQKSLANDEHSWKSHCIGGLFLILSTVPVVNPTYARTYFQGSYWKFLDTMVQNSGIKIGSTNIAHWIYCYDGSRAGLHLTFLPKGGTAVVAQDLLTEVEKSQIGLK